MKTFFTLIGCVCAPINLFAVNCAINAGENPLIYFIGLGCGLYLIFSN